MQNKEKYVERHISRLKSVMADSIKKKHFEKAMAAVSVGCQILYEFNQRYTDDDFENGVIDIAAEFIRSFTDKIQSFHSDRNTVLFYDGFGLDTRGVAKMYLNALKKNGYKIIYITGQASKECMPETDAILNDADAECFYIDFKSSYTAWTKELLEIVFRTSPKAMFYYTTPYDVSGAVAFAVSDGLADRFLIDLTDHAFWLGTKCNDYFCGSREMSASNQVYERGIEREKLIKLGVNLIVNETNEDHSGLPFDVEKTRYIFSGGALYKTLGDENRYYYRIIDHILTQNPDVYFLYAGSGDQSEMDKILKKYPNRAFLIPERKDFYYLIQQCTLYLNTYPMFGGMMMKYSAHAGKLPITLKHENDSDGLLLDQSSRKIEYETFEELIQDVDKLLSDRYYLKAREELLQGSTISEERFIRNVYSSIEEHRTDYNHTMERIDTSKFKEEFLDRFDIRQVETKVSRLINRSLFINCPWMLGVLSKNMVKKTLKRIKK